MLLIGRERGKGTNRENPRTIPEQIGKIPEKSGKSQKGQKRTKKEGQVQIGKTPPFETPRLAALGSTLKVFLSRNPVEKAASEDVEDVHYVINILSERAKLNVKYGPLFVDQSENVPERIETTEKNLIGQQITSE